MMPCPPRPRLRCPPGARRQLRSLVGPSALALALALVAPAALGKSAAVVASSQRPFQEAAEAALSELSGAGALHDATALRTGTASLETAPVVISIGPLAGGTVAEKLPANARVIAVLTPRLMGLPPERTLVLPLDPAPEEVLEVTRRLLPRAKRVGVLTGSAGPSASQLADVGRRHGFEVLSSGREEALSAALDRMLPSVDVLWVDRSHAAVADPESMKLVLARCADAGRPVVGSSKTHVLAGALFAVVPNPARHGEVAGHLARRLLAGENVRLVPTPPGTVLLSTKAAQRFDATVPAELKGRIEEVR